MEFVYLLIGPLIAVIFIIFTMIFCLKNDLKRILDRLDNLSQKNNDLERSFENKYMSTNRRIDEIYDLIIKMADDKK